MVIKVVLAGKGIGFSEIIKNVREEAKCKINIFLNI